jgi:glycine cleavage system aminomethyltransferase T
MSFEFLAADATAVAVDGERPEPRSPIEWEHRAAKARLGTRAGWRVVTGYGAARAEAAACRSSVGVADLSFLGKLELQGEAGVVEAIVAEFAGGAQLTPGQAALADGTWWCPISAERVLAVTPPEATASVRAAVEAQAAAQAGFVSVHELTTALCSNAVAGPLARETFARTTALDLRPQRFPEAAFAPVSVARIPGMILREHGDRFLHLFGAGYAHYVWTVFTDAATQLGGRAVGTDALGPGGGEAAADA